MYHRDDDADFSVDDDEVDDDEKDKVRRKASIIVEEVNSIFHCFNFDFALKSMIFHYF